MDVAQTVSGYVTRMVSAGDGNTAANAVKMKILLLDDDTVRGQKRYRQYNKASDNPRYPFYPPQLHNPPFSTTKSTLPSML